MIKTPAYVTRKELKEELIILKRGLKEELSGLEKKLDEKSKKYRDEILTGLDGVMK